MKTVYIRSDFLDGNTSIPIDIENDTHSDILKELEKHTKNINLNMFDLEYISHDEYTLNLNSLGELYFKVKNNEYPDFFPKDISYKNFDKIIHMNLLYKAIDNNNPNLVRDIISVKKYLINEIFFYRETPLKLAVFNGYLEIVKILLDAGANISGTKNSSGKLSTPDYGIYLNKRNEDTPLIIACDREYLDIVKVLLNPRPGIQGATHEPDQYGRTPLHHAAHRGNLEIVLELLKYNPKNIEDSYCMTPIDQALEENHLEVAKILKKHFKI